MPNTELDNLEVYQAKTKTKLKSRLWLLAAIFAAVNITAVITVVLYIGVKNGSLPDTGPLKALFDFAIELAKLLYSA